VNLPTVALALTALGLGSASVYLYTELDTARGRAEAEAALRRDQEGHLQALQANRLELERQLQALLGNSGWTAMTDTSGDEQAAPATPPRGSENTAEEAPPEAERNRRGMFAGVRNGFRNMLSTPEGRKAFQEQQKMGLRMMYKDLAGELNLTAEQAGQLIDLLAEQQVEQMVRLQEADGDPEAMNRILSEQQNTNDIKLMALLGDKYLQYDEYRQTLGERSQVEQLGMQFAAASIPLNPGQEKQLLSAMVQERQATPAPGWSPDLSPRENMARQREWQQSYNQRVREQMAGVLSTEQLKQYEDMQQAQSTMLRGGGMAMGFMGGGRRGGPGARIMMPPGQSTTTVTR
jgi:hypothetical protein